MHTINSLGFLPYNVTIFRLNSDIDLAFCEGNAAQFLIDVNENTNTLLFFDIIDLRRPVQQELLDSINKEGIVIYEKVCKDVPRSKG